MTPEQLQALREGLPLFGKGNGSTSQLAAYCRYYGIDFAARNPQLEHTVGIVESGGFRLAVHRWTQPRASSNLLLLHGYFDHTGLFGKLVDWALSRGCNVLVFDLPGHGLSTGEPAVIDDFGDYSRAIADVLDAVSLPTLPLWVMAQSTGAAALFDYADKNTWPFAATVLLAPLVRPNGWGGVRLAHTLLSPFIDSVSRSFSENSSDRVFLDFVANDPLQYNRIPLRWVGALRHWLRDLDIKDLGVGPALVIQGDADQTVDWRYNMEVVCKLFPGSSVEYLRGAGHHLANESDEYRRQYLDRTESWLAERGVALAARSGVKPGVGQ